MAGTDSRFDAALFRESIRFAMQMGLPNTTSQRATFKWDVERTYAVEDASSNPYDWTETPSTEVARPDVQVPVAVEFQSRAGESTDTRLGEFDLGRAVLTVLDEDFVALTVSGRFADKVELDGSIYEINFVAPPVGLFDVTVYSIHVQAQDEK